MSTQDMALAVVALLIVIALFSGWIAVSLQRMADRLDDSFRIDINWKDLAEQIKELRRLTTTK